MRSLPKAGKEILETRGNSRSSHSGPSLAAQLKPCRMVSLTPRSSFLSTCLEVSIDDKQIWAHN